jgi:hypothetical protein
VVADVRADIENYRSRLEKLPHQFEALANAPEPGEELPPMMFSGEINLAI